MKSYSKQRALYARDTKNTSADNLTFGDEVMNDWHRQLLSKHDWPFLHRLRTKNTVANETFVALPHDMDLVESVFVTVASTRYTPKAAPSREFWDKLHYSSYNSDIPEWWFVYDGKIGLWPQPSTSDNVISINGKIRVSDLNVADYTTGTITSVTNGGTTVVAAGTAFTNAMVGRWLRITQDDTAESGDGIWYEIVSVTNTTTLELARAYGGSTIAAATKAYTVGMMPLLPEAYQGLPEIYGALRYWIKEGDASRRKSFLELLVEGTRALFTSYSVNDLSMVVDLGIYQEQIINPNLTITL